MQDNTKKKRKTPPPVPVQDNNVQNSIGDDMMIPAVKYEMPPVPVSTEKNKKNNTSSGTNRNNVSKGKKRTTQATNNSSKSIKSGTNTKNTAKRSANTSKQKNNSSVEKEPIIKREINLNEFIEELDAENSPKKRTNTTKTNSTSQASQTETSRESGTKNISAETPKNEKKEKVDKKVIPVEKIAKENEKKKKKHPVIGFIFRLVVIFMILGTASAVALFAYLVRGVPELDLSKKDYYSMASTIYDENGHVLANFAGTENVNWATFDEIPEMLRNAFISIEDKRFYTHPGVDAKRTIYAIYGQLSGTSEQGGSTITQQLIKNTHLTSAKTYQRKAQEIYLALQMEQKLSKNEILEWYLNDIFLGENNYGVKNAAKDYFGKEMSELTIRECAMLAGLAQSPSYFDPRVNYYNDKRNVTDGRTNNVLYTMHDNGYITDKEYQDALAEEVTIKQYPERFVLYSYPTYMEYAAEDAAYLLLAKEGKSPDDITSEEASEMIRNGGYKIYTAFDEKIQNDVQTAITDFTLYPKSKSDKQAEASAVVIDQHNGRVLAMVSGRSEPTVADSYNRATDSVQAVGSSMKPLSVYAPALDTGCFPGTTVEDMPKKIQGYNTEQGYPGGETTNAMITMRRALELSHNIPAVRFMLEKVGIDRCREYLVSNGFRESELSMTPAGMALGADSVTTLEMTAAYATLANGGTYIRPHAVIRVEDRYGNVLIEESSMDRHRVFKETSAWLVTDMLETNMIEGLGVNARLNGMHCAGKTGTHEHKVVSFGGYTPYYTSFVRISTDDYADFYNSSSYTQSAGLWKSYMQKIHEGLSDREIKEKTDEALGIKKYWVCTNSGLLANNWCAGCWEYATEDSAPVEYCSGHNYGVKQETYENTAPQINYADPEWYLHGWWGEDGVFHPE